MEHLERLFISLYCAYVVLFVQKDDEEDARDALVPSVRRMDSIDAHSSRHAWSNFGQRCSTFNDDLPTYVTIVQNENSSQIIQVVADIWVTNYFTSLALNVLCSSHGVIRFECSIHIRTSGTGNVDSNSNICHFSLMTHHCCCEVVLASGPGYILSTWLPASYWSHVCIFEMSQLTVWFPSRQNGVETRRSANQGCENINNLSPISLVLYQLSCLNVLHRRNAQSF